MKTNKQTKIFFFDVDYTTFDHIHRIVRPLTLYSIRELKENGYKICISTSRNYDELETIGNDFLKLADVISTLAGARIIYSDRTESFCIDKDSVYKLIKYFNEKNVTYRYANNEGIGYLSNRDEYVERIFKQYFDMVPQIKEYDGENVLQIMYYTFDNLINEEIKKIVPNLIVNNMKLNNEITSKNIDKGSVMDLICKQFDCTCHDAVVFGDSENDITMMQKAGFSVCMGNGSDVAKKYADYVCETIEEDGLYKSLVKFGYIKEYKDEQREMVDIIFNSINEIKNNENISIVANLFRESILNNGVIQMIGIGKYGQFAQELYYRAGGLVPFHKLDYDNEDFESFINKYQININDLFVLISESGDEEVLNKICKYAKYNKQKVVAIVRRIKDNDVCNDADVVYELLNVNGPIKHTIDDIVAQMLSFKTYELLKESNNKPLTFMSNNNPDAAKYNIEILRKYKGRVHD